MNTAERMLIEILAQIQLRVMAKRQSGLINPDCVDQNESGEMSKRTDGPFAVIQNDAQLEKADDALG